MEAYVLVFVTLALQAPTYSTDAPTAAPTAAEDVAPAPAATKAPVRAAATRAPVRTARPTAAAATPLPAAAPKPLKPGFKLVGTNPILLTAAAETSGGAAGASGNILLQYSDTEICYDLVTAGLTDIKAAHIHNGPVGADGAYLC
jgi:CHRD domain